MGDGAVPYAASAVVCGHWLLLRGSATQMIGLWPWLQPWLTDTLVDRFLHALQLRVTRRSSPVGT